MALTQVQADNPSEILLNRNQQIVYSLYRGKQISKKVSNSLMKSI